MGELDYDVIFWWRDIELGREKGIMRELGWCNNENGETIEMFGRGNGRSK